ncbi:MAG: hypothetical protein BYD32DRAFT_484251 [Podila humilis]|nr:MAG: hypothetical protein BYD32DRAFT_484251 [Podila humilis]
MIKAPANKLSHSADSSMSVSCQLSDLSWRPVVFQNSAEDFPCLRSSRFTLIHPWLYISLEWKTRTIFKKLSVFSKDGKSVSAEMADKTEKNSKMTTVKIDASVVTTDQCVTFDIVLSTKSNSRAYPKKDNIYPHHGLDTLGTLMKDIGSMDVALTFGLNGGARNIALWAHRSVLSQQPGLAKLISKLRSVEGSLTDSAVASGIQSHHVHEYSLEGYCGLIHFLYTGTVELKVDLDDFAIGFPPNKPFSIACKERPNLDELFLSPASTGSDAVFKGETSFSELFLLADCYEVGDLRAHCRIQILQSMTVRNSLDILFGFAYRFEDLKDEVLQYVSSNINTMYSAGEDPFNKYQDHPERHTLLAEALKMRYMGHPQSNCSIDSDEDEKHEIESDEY